MYKAIDSKNLIFFPTTPKIDSCEPNADVDTWAKDLKRFPLVLLIGPESDAIPPFAYPILLSSQH